MPLLPDQDPATGMTKTYARTPALVVLVVGNMASWHRAGRAVPVMNGFHFTSFGGVTDELMQAVAPELVLSALTGDDYDVIELARRLAVLHYTGRYRALTSGLPNPRVVLNEVQAAAPGIDFDLFDLDKNALSAR